MMNRLKCIKISKYSTPKRYQFFLYKIIFQVSKVGSWLTSILHIFDKNYKVYNNYYNHFSI